MEARLSDVAAEIERRLREAGTPERAAHEKRYLKSSLVHLGASMPVIHRVVKAVDVQYAPRTDEVMRLAELLWASPIHELRAAAVDLLERHASELPPSAVDLIERLLRASRTWALVDGLAASVAGPLFVAQPEVGKRLDRWAADEDFWVRRAALLALLPQLRGDDERAREKAFARFVRYADRMLDETEFFIRKAIGWVLRDTGKRRPDLVESYVAERLGRLSGLSVREAARSQPAATRERLLVEHARATGKNPPAPRTRTRTIRG